MEKALKAVTVIAETNIFRRTGTHYSTQLIFYLIVRYISVKLNLRGYNSQQQVLMFTHLVLFRRISQKGRKEEKLQEK
jgi:hypothetical protein